MVLLSAVKPRMTASITRVSFFPPVQTLHLLKGIFLDSHLRSSGCMFYGVVLTKKDLVQALSVCLKLGLCDVAVFAGQGQKTLHTVSLYMASI